MPTGNENYLDSQLRHAVGVRRYTSGEVKRMLALLEKADADMARKLRRKLGPLTRKRDITSERWRALIQDIRSDRIATFQEMNSDLRANMREFAKVEAAFESRLIQAAVPVEIALGMPAAERLGAIVTSKPFQGRLLRDWMKGLAVSDRARLEQAITLGITQGEGVDTIVRRVIGTRRGGYTDGVLSATRREAEALVRTTVNHVSNAAREEMWHENEEVIRALRWEATLDSRTSPICRARDGAMAPVGGRPLPRGARSIQPPEARPPAHINCRSVMIAVLDSDAEVFAGLNRQSEIGPVPQETTYNEWLGRQPAAFQDEVLGKSRGALFRRGGLHMDQFVDRRGNELTLEQLRKTQPEAFGAAGL